MSKNDKLIRELIEQEDELQFDSFTDETALELGLKLVETAKARGHRITIGITRAEHRLFHYAFDGTSPDNDVWVDRKCRAVMRFRMSSYRLGVELANQGLTIKERYLIGPEECAPYGGAFPIVIRNVGVVGAIVVSGLAQEDDHALVVETLRSFL